MLNLEKERQQFSKKLQALKDKGTFPAALLDLLEMVANKQYQVMSDDKATTALLPEVTSQDRHIHGASLLPRASFPVALEPASKLLRAILEDVQAVGSDLGTGAGLVMEALDSHELECERIFRAYLEEDQDFFTVWSEKNPGAPKLMQFLAQSTLRPFMDAVAQQIRTVRPQQGVWEHGHCFVCGSLPFISRLETREGLRMMHCSFCSSAYRVGRIGCVYCGERDPKKLRYFEAEEVPGFRIDLCDQCKMYIKTIDFRKMDRPSVPILDDLESLTLDVLAQTRGYVRPTLSAWGF
jgi:FdhE protein